MAVKLQGRFTNTKELLHTRAQSTGFYDDNMYKALSGSEQEQYLQTLNGTLSIADNRFDSFTYNNLTDPNEKFSYVVASFYDKENEESNNYFREKAQSKVVYDAYQSSTGLQKTLSSLVTVGANVVNTTVFGAIEGLIDLGILIHGAVANYAVGDDFDTNKALAKDITGYNKQREEISEYARLFSYVDKLDGWKIVNDVAVGFSRLSINLIPVAGQAIYFASMAGNTAEEVAITNPNISTWRLLGYTATSVAIEFATEHLFTDFFIKGLKSVPAGSSLMRRLLQTGAQEALEEGSAEIFNSLAYRAWIDPSEKIASLEEIGYAALIGGLIGMLGVGGQIVSTQSTLNEVDGSETPVTIKGKLNVLNFKELMAESSNRISELNTRETENFITNIMKNEPTLTIQQVEQKYEKELNDARKIDQEKQDKALFAISGLNAIFNKVGSEGFTDALTTLENGMSDMESRIAKYVEATNKNYKNQNIASNRSIKDGVNLFEKTYANHTINVVDNISGARKDFSDEISKRTGKKVLLGEFLAQNGKPDVRGVSVIDDYIFVDSATFDKIGAKPIIESIVSQEVGRLMRVALSEPALNEFIKEFEQIMPNKVSELSRLKPYEKQQFMLNALINDTYTMEMLYQRDKGLFSKTLTFFEQRFKIIKRDPERVHFYSEFINSMRTIMVKYTANYNDYVNVRTSPEVTLTKEEFDKIRGSGTDDRYSTFIPYNINLATAHRLKIRSDLLKVVKNKFESNLDLNRILDIEYYDESFAQELFKRYPALQNEIPSRFFAKAMSSYLKDTYDIYYNPVLKKFIKPINLENSNIVNQNMLADILSNWRPRKNQFFRLHDILTPLGKRLLPNVSIDVYATKTSIDGAYYPFSQKIILNNRLTSNGRKMQTLSHEITHAVFNTNFSFGIGVVGNNKELSKLITERLKKVHGEKYDEFLGMASYIFDMDERLAGHDDFKEGSKFSNPTAMVYKTESTSTIRAVGTGDLFGIDVAIDRFNDKITKQQVDKKKTLYHRDVFWLNRFDVAVNNMIREQKGITFAKHVFDQANEKLARRNYTKMLNEQSVIDALKDPNKLLFEFDSTINKFVIRVKYDADTDVSIVFFPQPNKTLNVGTMWVNFKDDVHSTLRTDNYVQTPSRDSLGNTVSPETVRIFKNTKVVDYDGQLLPVSKGDNNYYFARIVDGAEIGYLNLVKPLIVDAGGAMPNQIEYDGKIMNTTQIVESASKSGLYDGVIFENVIDPGENLQFASEPTNVYVGFNNAEFERLSMPNMDIKEKRSQDKLTPKQLDVINDTVDAIDGATIDPKTGSPVNYTNGYQVSFRDIKSVPRDQVNNAVEELYAIWQKEYKGKEDAYIGVWLNSKTGLYDVDFSKHIIDPKEAYDLAVKGNQEAVYDWAEGESPKTPDFGKSIGVQQDRLDVESNKKRVDVTNNPIINSIFADVKGNMKDTPIRETETQKINNAKRLEYYVLSVKMLQQFSSKNLNSINDTNVVDILSELFNPDLRLDVYEQRIRSALIVYIMMNKDNYKSPAIRKKIEEYFQIYANQAGVQLSLISQIYRQVDPAGATITEFENTYGITISTDAELTQLRDDLQAASEANDYNEMNRLNNEIVARISDLIRKNYPKYDFLTGTPAQKKRKFRLLMKNILAFRYLAMLSNPSTHLGNIISNYGQKQVAKLDRLSGKLFEKWTMRKNELTMKANEAELKSVDESIKNTPEDAKENVAYKDLLDRKKTLERMIKSGKEQYNFTGGTVTPIIQSKVKTELVDSGLLEHLMSRSTSKYTPTGEVALQHKIGQKVRFKSKIAQKVYEIETWSLEGMDNVFVTKETIKNLERLIAANFEANLDAMTDTDFDNLVSTALRQSMETFFRNKNAFAEWWTSTMRKHWLLEMTMGGILPFPNVASNILVQIYKHSPANFVNTLVTQLRGNVYGENTYYAELARNYGQATTGTVFMIMGVMLKLLGVLDMDEDENNGMVVRIGDVRIKLSALAPSISPMLLGAAMISDNPVESMLSNLYEQTLLGNMNSLFQYNYSLEDAFIKSPFESYTLQYIPALFKSVTRATDASVNDTSGQYKFLKRIASSLPLVSNLFVPNKKDPYTGENYMKSGLTAGPIDFVAFFNIFNPIKFIYDDPNYYADRAREIGTEAGFTTGRFVINAKEIHLSGRELENYAENRGKIIKKMMTKLLASGEFRRLSTDDRQKELENVYSKATHYAKVDYWTKKGNRFAFANTAAANEFRKTTGTNQRIIVIKRVTGSRFLEQKK